MHLCICSYLTVSVLPTFFPFLFVLFIFHIYLCFSLQLRQLTVDHRHNEIDGDRGILFSRWLPRRLSALRKDTSLGFEFVSRLCLTWFSFIVCNCINPSILLPMAYSICLRQSALHCTSILSSQYHYQL